MRNTIVCGLVVLGLVGCGAPFVEASADPIADEAGLSAEQHVKDPPDAARTVALVDAGDAAPDVSMGPDADAHDAARESAPTSLDAADAPVGAAMCSVPQCSNTCGFGQPRCCTGHDVIGSPQPGEITDGVCGCILDGQGNGPCTPATEIPDAASGG